MRCKFSDIIQLFFPETCVICENTLGYGKNRMYRLQGSLTPDFFYLGTGKSD